MILGALILRGISIAIYNTKYICKGLVTSINLFLKLLLCLLSMYNREDIDVLNGQTLPNLPLLIKNIYFIKTDADFIIIRN